MCASRIDASPVCCLLTQYTSASHHSTAKITSATSQVSKATNDTDPPTIGTLDFHHLLIPCWKPQPKRHRDTVRIKAQPGPPA